MLTVGVEARYVFVLQDHFFMGERGGGKKAQKGQKLRFRNNEMNILTDVGKTDSWNIEMSEKRDVGETRCRNIEMLVKRDVGT